MKLSKRLTSCDLWAGSMLSLHAKFGTLTLAHLKDKIAKLERCDDLTRAEKEFLAALKAEARK